MIETSRWSLPAPWTALRLCVVIAIATPAANASAADLRITVADSRGQSAAQVVVVARPIGAAAAANAAKSATVTQQFQTFTPGVMPISVGTTVEFPNLDRMRHHVYSFSPAKTFEIHLYSGEDTPKVTFDVPGVITLGCNIHDWMTGYLYVTDAPYFAATDEAGIATLRNVPPGEYRLAVWHPKLDAEANEGTTRVGTTPATVDLKVAAVIEPIAQHRPDDDPLLVRLRTSKQ